MNFFSASARRIEGHFGKKAAFLIIYLLVGKLLADFIMGGSPLVNLVRTKLPLIFIVTGGLILLVGFGPVRTIQVYSFFWWVAMVAPQVPLLKRFIGHVNIMEYFLYFIASFGIFDLFKHGLSGNRGRFLRNVLVMMLPMCIFGIIGLTRSIDYDVGIDYFRWSIIYPLAILFVMLYFIRTKNDISKVLTAFCLGTGLMSIIILMASATGTFFTTINTVRGERLGGIIRIPGTADLIFEPVALGCACSFALPIIAINFFRSNRLSAKIQAIIIFLLLLSVIFLTGVRGPWIASGTSLFILLLLLIRHSYLRLKVVLAIILAIVLIWLLFYYVGSANESILYRIESLRSLEDVMADRNLQARIAIWENHLFLIKNNLIIPYGYFYLYGSGNSHNMFIFFALGVGIAGLGCFLLLIIMIGKHLFKNFRKGSSAMRLMIFGSFSSLMAMLVSGIADNTFSEGYCTASIYISLGLGLAATFIVEGKNNWISKGRGV